MTPPANRREFLKATGATVAAIGLASGASSQPPPLAPVVVAIDDFARPDSHHVGDAWESLNPGYWKIEAGAMRRRLKNRGDRARNTGFPYHWESHERKPMPTEYDPSLPFGMIWRRDRALSGNFTIRAEFAIRGEAPTGEAVPEAERAWKMNNPGWGVAGICFGGECLFESWSGGGADGDASLFAAWSDDGRFGLFDHRQDALRLAADPSGERTALAAPAPRAGDRATIVVSVSGDDPAVATLAASLTVGDPDAPAFRGEVSLAGVDRAKFLNGYFGIVGRGLLDFEVASVAVEFPDAEAEARSRLDVPLNELHVAIPLLDTLREKDGAWRCRFVALFRNDGERAEIRIAESPDPAGGWAAVPVAGSGAIVTNDFRISTAIVEVALPGNPAESEFHYTVWKDGRDVTPDPREGWLGRKDYVGRLPRLAPPYSLCGLSCHAIVTGGPELPRSGKFQKNWIYDQPTPDAFKHIEDYDFQIMLWEDDVWYLELLIYPPSVDDAYKTITTTIAGPTTRWQTMRHWNAMNPGDHDHGMDDVKGPEQLAIRRSEGTELGQDSEYLRRNFEIVYHLMNGLETPPLATENPRRWRRWRAPLGDFSLLILDSRLWRTTQDTHFWDEWGWAGKGDLHDRADPTRALLGEEQFAWLEETIRTDPSPLICLTGLNGLHTIWQGFEKDQSTGLMFAQRDRVATDYAGWAKAGCDRVIELLGSRPGVVTVYGDVHNGSIVRNVEHGLFECSFGPIGRTGGRTPKEGFAPSMTDYDGRELEAIALYHQKFGSPSLDPIEGPNYWNFLEARFDPRGEDPRFALKIRNVVDPPGDAPRGGGFVDARASATGGEFDVLLPPIVVGIPDADVFFADEDGRPLRGARSLADGRVPVAGLTGARPGETLTVVARKGDRVEAATVRALDVTP